VQLTEYTHLPNLNRPLEHQQPQTTTFLVVI
jgi:hypothetical protein